MKHKVLKIFRDRESGKVFEPGSFYESKDHQRVTMLDEKGFVKANKEADTLKEEKPKSKTRKKASE